MRSLPAPLRDFVTGLGMVALVILVLRLVDPRGVGPETWLLLPVGAVLFTMRQAVRRAVLRRVEQRPPDDTDDVDGTARPAAPSGAAAPSRAGAPAPAPPGPPVAPRPWQEDPARVIGVGVLVVVALVALAFL